MSDTRKQDTLSEDEQKAATESDAQSASPAPDLSAESPSDGLPQEVNWEEEAKKFQDLYIRATAEQENLKKRLEREKDETVKFANENFIKELLPIMDNLERALDHVENGDSNLEGMVEGVRMIYQSFYSILEKFGVKSVAALGEKFDPQYHEAVMQEENPDTEDGTIIKEVQRGYLLKERLIRPAMVVVSRKPALEEPNGQVA